MIATTGDERLAVLADWLEQRVLPQIEAGQGEFDMRAWGMRKECGFAGCLVGWGTFCPDLPGLRIVDGEPWLDDGDDEENNGEGLGSVAEFYGLTIDETEWIFIPTSRSSCPDLLYGAPALRAGVARIREHLARKAAHV